MITFSTGVAINAITVSVVDGTTKNYTLEIGDSKVIGLVDAVNKKVKFPVDDKTLESSTVSNIIDSPNDTVKKAIGSMIIFTTGVELNAITLNAEDGTIINYTLELISNKAVLPTLTLNIGGAKVIGQVDEVNKKMKFTASNMVFASPTVSNIIISPNATVNKVVGNAIGFSTGKSTDLITRTAENGITKQDYTIDFKLLIVCHSICKKLTLQMLGVFIIQL